MNDRRLATLGAIAETLAPPAARVERILVYAAAALDTLSPKRAAEAGGLLDLLALPMKLGVGMRARVLLALADSPVAKLRTGFALVKRLLLYVAYAESEPDDPNPAAAAIGYPGPRTDRGCDDPALPYATATEGETVSADVVVIGSGAGGGVVASAFARAGKRVVVLEAGRAFDARSFDQREISMSQTYLDAGLTATEDLGIAILAGATVGGGTTVNWCTSFRLPDRIASEWAQTSGIAGLPAELAPHYERIERELGLSIVAHHNANNRIILDGARALGIHAGELPRNAPADCGAGCGFCGFGCAYGKKRSTARAFLPDLATAGGALYAQTQALRILRDGRRATGVIAEQTAADGARRRFTIHADLVVVCGGSLRSPGILARSGITSSALGRRLHLHPVTAVIPEFDRDIEPYLGPMQSAYSDAYNYRSGNYGPKIEAAPTHPGIAALATPWTSREQHASAMAAAKRSASLIAVTRDRDSGSIDLDDEAYIRYRVSPFDGANLIEGILGMTDIAFAAGALRVTTLHNKPIVIERAQWSLKRRAAFRDRLRAIGTAPNRQIVFSAHQMGTCAMGSREADSVVDPSGCVWGYDNLLVADASVFPQASGVNPMLTIMAMASRIAEQHGGRLRSADLPAKARVH